MVTMPANHIIKRDRDYHFVIILILATFLSIQLHLQAQEILPDDQESTVEQKVDLPPQAEEDLPPPMLFMGFIFVVIMFVVFVVVAICLIALGILAGIAGLIVVFFGIATAATAIGYATRSLRSGAGAFLYMSFILAGIASGALGGFAIHHYADPNFSSLISIILGASTGSLLMLPIAYFLLRVAYWIEIKIRQKIENRTRNHLA